MTRRSFRNLIPLKQLLVYPAAIVLSVAALATAEYGFTPTQPPATDSRDSSESEANSLNNLNDNGGPAVTADALGEPVSGESPTEVSGSDSRAGSNGLSVRIQTEAGSTAGTDVSIDADSDGLEIPDVKINGQTIEPDEHGRVRETIETDDDSQVRVRVRSDRDSGSTSSDSVSISVDSAPNSEEGGGL